MRGGEGPAEEKTLISISSSQSMKCKCSNDSKLGEAEVTMLKSPGPKAL